MRKTKAAWFVAAIVGLLLAWSSGTFPSVRADDELSLSKCPASVQKTLEREAHGGKIQEVEKERHGGKTVFEAEVVLDGRVYEVVIAKNGLLLYKVLEDLRNKDRSDDRATRDDDDGDDDDGDDDDGDDDDGDDDGDDEDGDDDDGDDDDGDDDDDDEDQNKK